MECKDGIRRTAGSCKPSKGGDDEDNRNARSSSYKAKEVRNNDHASGANRTNWRTDYPSEAKPEILGAVLGTKDEKDAAEMSPRRRSLAATIECIQEEKADSEFEELMRRPSAGGEITIPTDPAALAMLNGFKMWVTSFAVVDNNT